MDASPHVLVVDDHREIREPLARYLERHELRVTVAESAAAARRALKTAAVDLVVLDIMMPGEDGLALCRHLRETTRIGGRTVVTLTKRASPVEAARTARTAAPGPGSAGGTTRRGSEFPRAGSAREDSSPALLLSRYRAGQARWPVFHTGAMVQAFFDGGHNRGDNH